MIQTRKAVAVAGSPRKHLFSQLTGAYAAGSRPQKDRQQFRIRERTASIGNKFLIWKILHPVIFIVLILVSFHSTSFPTASLSLNDGEDSPAKACVRRAGTDTCLHVP